MLFRAEDLPAIRAKIGRDPFPAVLAAMAARTALAEGVELGARPSATMHAHLSEPEPVSGGPHEGAALRDRLHEMNGQIGVEAR